MISCSLQGGMANQMFQIMGTVALAKRHNFEVGFDLNSYTPLQGHQGSKYADNLFAKVPRLNGQTFKYSYQEPHFRYSELPKQDDMIIVNSYLQSYKYWEGYEDELKEMFNTGKLNEDFSNHTAVHIRRGDYLNYPRIHPVCSIEYYKKAMEMIGGDFIFVSDDMKWVKENFIGDNIYYSEFKSEIDDFRLIKQAKNVICANSTFSLLAAWLNDNKDKKVIVPSVWFGPDGPDSSDLIPPDFIKL